MILRDFYLRNDQDKRLRKLLGKNSEHVRNALDDYFNKIDREELKKLNVSNSKS